MARDWPAGNVDATQHRPAAARAPFTNDAAYAYARGHQPAMPSRQGHRARGAPMTHLIDVRELSLEFDVRGMRVPVLDKVSFRIRPGTHRGAGRRVRLGQVGHRAGDHGHPAARSATSPAARSCSPTPGAERGRSTSRRWTRTARAARDPRRPHLDDLPGADDARCRRCTRSATRSARRCPAPPASTEAPRHARTVEMLRRSASRDPARALHDLSRSSSRAACGSAR